MGARGVVLYGVFSRIHRILKYDGRYLRNEHGDAVINCFALRDDLQGTRRLHVSYIEKSLNVMCS